MTAPHEKLTIKLPTPVPDMGTGPISTEPYISPEYFDREREKIFRRAWLNVGRVDEIPESGDYTVKEIAILGVSVLIVRGKDGQVRAFYNTCTHRGMAVADCKPSDKGNTSKFACPFHGWTFDLDGSLSYLPGKEYFYGVEQDKLGLRQLSLDTWNGFIFVNQQEHPEQPLREFLGGLADDLEDYPFERFSHIARYKADVAVNWKTFIDAFHEAYHVEMVHGQTVPDAANSPENPHAVPTSVRIHHPHHSVSIPVNPDFKPTPAAAIGAGESR